MVQHSSLFIGFRLSGIWSGQLTSSQPWTELMAVQRLKRASFLISLGLRRFSAGASEWVWTVVFLSGGLALLAFPKMELGASQTVYRRFRKCVSGVVVWWIDLDALRDHAYFCLVAYDADFCFAVDASFTLFRRIVNGEKVSMHIGPWCTRC